MDNQILDLVYRGPKLSWETDNGHFVRVYGPDADQQRDPGTHTTKWSM